MWVHGCVFPRRGASVISLFFVVSLVFRAARPLRTRHVFLAINTPQFFFAKKQLSCLCALSIVLRLQPYFSRLFTPPRLVVFPAHGEGGG